VTEPTGILLLLFGLSSDGLGETVRVREERGIRPVGMSCIPEDDFAVVVAEIKASAPFRSVKLYFRSALYPDFYFVEMKPFEPDFAGVLPQPSPETQEIVYYIEVVDDAFNGSRTVEFTSPVQDPCSRRQAVAYFNGEGPAIVVGSVSHGASALPPGFKALGIVGTISAAGAVTSVGGGVGAATVVAAGAAVAGATGAVVVATGGGAPSTSTIASSPPPASGSEAPPAGSTSTPVSTSTTTTTTTSTGPSTTSVATTTTPPTTSVPSTTTSVVPPPVVCFNTTNIGLCRLRLDASCSSGAIDQYDWELDIGGVLRGPASRTGQVIVFDYALYPSCLGRTVTNVLTVTGPGGQDSSTQTFRFLFQRHETVTSALRFSAVLETADPESSPRVTITVNGAASRTLGGPSPLQLAMDGRRGRNTIEARIEPSFVGDGTLTLDFSRTEHLIPGTVVVERGDELGIEGSRVVFRVDGGSQTFIRFVLELAADAP
jgi:hypothetical protein